LWGEVILICTLEGGAYECVMDGRKRLYSCIEYIILAVLFHILDYWASVVIEHFYQSHRGCFLAILIDKFQHLRKHFFTIIKFDKSM